MPLSSFLCVSNLLHYHSLITTPTFCSFPLKQIKMVKHVRSKQIQPIPLCTPKSKAFVFTLRKWWQSVSAILKGAKSHIEHRHLRTRPHGNSLTEDGKLRTYITAIVFFLKGIWIFGLKTSNQCRAPVEEEDDDATEQVEEDISVALASSTSSSLLIAYPPCRQLSEYTDASGARCFSPGSFSITTSGGLVTW